MPTNILYSDPATDKLPAGKLPAGIAAPPFAQSDITDLTTDLDEKANFPFNGNAAIFGDGAVISPGNYSASVTATGSGVMWTNDTGKQFIVTGIVVKLLTIANYIAVGSVSAGTNAASYNNVLAITPLTGLTAVDTSLYIPILLAHELQNGEAIRINLTTAFTADSGSYIAYPLGFVNRD